MEVIITDSAYSRLVSEFEQEAIELRVLAIDTYECSTMLEFQLALDERRIEDTVITCKKVNVLLDQKAIEEIGHYLKVDYYANQGYRLINSAQTLAYGLRIKKNNV
ncbi:hypothetical protein BTR23_07835 [Alkalihalophilus pseudofirmus]|uniref:iron-sulfur cluster biosynthesis family protein n=1 Tax=Alkalihalobacterium alkalinitrilicum TaxID=427920 RepID=UPI00094D459C|nr:iron-sulfur cluster biosynthesis family protein [Alkalihalobacterium alkalinitrilicum]OLO40388.1 hypothetical protein BTR23_07835 [Alkalihalophilus pseudofirmus]